MASVDSREVERLVSLAAAHGANATIERAPPEMKSEFDVFGENPPSLALMREVKGAFDPGGILSPGRFVGRL
jgi:glycolate oxidase FAD binding subunit